MSEHNWKTSQRRSAKGFQPTFTMSQSLPMPASSALNSIQESSIGTGTSSRSSAHSTSGTLSRGSRDSIGSRHSSRSLGLAEPTHFEEDKMDRHSILNNEGLDAENAGYPANDHEELEREIENEIGNMVHINATNHHEDDNDDDDDDDDDESEDGPVIYAQQQDDDDFSQITSSIAGNTLYSHEYMFSSISFPKGRFQTNTNKGFMGRNGGTNINNGMPSLDGTDSGGSGGSNSHKSKMDVGKSSSIMEDKDFDRFFGSSSQNSTNILAGASGPHRRNPAKSSEEDGLLDNTVNIYNNSNLPSHRNVNNNSGLASENQCDDITLSDIYSYAPSTADPTRGTALPDRKPFNSNSSNPLLWIYNQAYNLFTSARGKDRRKKNDDLEEESIDGDADYFGTLMSAEFVNSSPQSYPWAQQHRVRRRQSMVTFIFVACFISYLIVVSKDEIEVIRSRPHLEDSSHSVRGTKKVDEPTLIESSSVSNAKTERVQESVQSSVAAKAKTSSHVIDQSHIGTTLPDIFNNFADVSESSTGHLPFFWHIPRTAGATVNDILSICTHKKIATNIGIADGHHKDSELKIVDFEGQKYVNVDIATKPGIARAVQMDFASSNLAEVAISSHVHDSALLFNSSKKGKMFAFFRHPVDRAVSMFYFMQDTVWKADATYNKELAEISIENFFMQKRGENNWKVRFLTNQLTKPYVDGEDFNLAKEVLRRKCLVGLLTDKEESMDRFSKHFGWNLGSGRKHQCAKKKLQWDWSLRHPHEVEIVEGNRLWNLIVQQNFYDMQLYEYAQALFEEQSKMFPI